MTEENPSGFGFTLTSMDPLIVNLSALFNKFNKIYANLL